MILFFTSDFANIDAYTAKLPPFECPPTLILFSYLLATLFKYSTASNCEATWLLKLILKSSFQPIKVSSVPLYDTKIVLSGSNNVIAENCFSCSLFILFTKFVAIILPNLSELPNSGINLLSSGQSTFIFVLSALLNLWLNSVIEISSPLFISISNGKYANLVKIKLSISLNSKSFNSKSPLHFT